MLSLSEINPSGALAAAKKLIAALPPGSVKGGPDYAAELESMLKHASTLVASAPGTVRKLLRDFMTRYLDAVQRA